MISEGTIRIGSRYKIIGHTKTLLDRAGDMQCPSVGSIGICKWGNYRGACLKFPDNLGYIIPFDCLGEVDEKPKFIFRSVPTNETAECGQFRYRFSKLPDEGIQLIGKVGKLCQIRWTSGADKVACVHFENGEECIVALSTLEDVGC